jgi:hypothetical protein
LSDHVTSVGKGAHTFHQPAEKAETEFWKKAKQIRPSCDDYGWPQRGAAAELASLTYQFNQVKRPDFPPHEKLKEVMALTNKDYYQFKLPSFWESFNEDLLNKKIDEFKDFLKPDSSPGVPYAQYGATNKTCLANMGSEFNRIVIERLRKYKDTPAEEIRAMSADELVKAGLADPVRVFVKDEPHKKAKIKQNRFRIIASVSIVHKMIEMLANRDLHKQEIALWKEIPSKPGIGFTDEDNAFMWKDVHSEPGRKAENDTRGFDFSVRPEEKLICAEGVIDLCSNPSEFWERVQLAMALVECVVLWYLSDGTLLISDMLGMMLSGLYVTSRRNSWLRNWRSKLIGVPWIKCAGDDAVEAYIEDAVEKYSKYNWVVTGYKEIIDDFVFCSRVYKKDSSHPETVEKTLMNLLHNVPKTLEEYEGYMMQFTDQVKNHPDFSQIMNLIEKVGYLPQAFVAA